MTCPHCGAIQRPDARVCPVCGRPLLASISSRCYQFTDANGRVMPLPEGVSRIGRDPASNEITLEDASVSARHAAVEVSPRAIVLRDLGSRDGTQVNGQPLSHATVIHEGDRVTFGAHELTLTRREPELTTPLRALPLPPQATSQPRTVETSTAQHVTTAVATIALTLLALLLNGVALADGVQRDDLPLPLAVLLVALVGAPLIAIVVLAAGRRSGYLLAAASGIIGLIFIATTGPVMADSGVRDDLTAEYGSTGFWFIAGASLAALLVEILVLTVAFAGWRAMRRPPPGVTGPVSDYT